MENDRFEKLAKKIVVDYVNKHLDKSDGVVIDESNVFIVLETLSLKDFLGIKYVAGIIT